ncbi:MAG TPA: hypothetical protein VD736_04070 [Nitrososphaera sp.]|nr:hypothetical protein [Nitrososphaera sp.]
MISVMSPAEAEKVLNELRDVVKVCRWWFDHGSVEYINNLQQTKDNLESVNRFIDECKDPDERVKLYQRRNAIAESYGMLLQNYEKIASYRSSWRKSCRELKRSMGWMLI